MAEQSPNLQQIDPELEMLKLNQSDGYNYRERRHDDWNETYALYRDKVQINRLTQRQSVHVPLMKYQIRTLMKDIDDMPVLHYKNLDNNKDAEIFKNEYWKKVVEDNNLELQDIIDKKQVLMFGRSYMQMQIINGKVVFTVTDPMDILVSRYVDPFNLHSSRYLIHNHIFVPLATIERNRDYYIDAIEELKLYHATEKGLLKAKENEQMLIEKNQKLSDLGVSDVDSPVLGETYVELSLHFVYREDEPNGNGGFHPKQIFLYVVADGMKILMKKPLESIMGVTKDHYWRDHYPYTTWADDLERQDWYSDGTGDIIRTANKIADVWYSQMVENRTLRSLGMQYYNGAESDDFQPQTYQPQAFGWYALPGKPSEMVQRVDIPELSESMDEVNFVISLSEKASGATATQQGVVESGNKTLGEIDRALVEAKERVKGTSKFYTPAWKERGEQFVKLIEGASDKLTAVRVHKKGRITNDIYTREIAPDDWKSELGYICQVWTQDEKDAKDLESLKKMDIAKMNMPDNPVVVDEHRRKVLEFADFSPEKINEAMEFEEMKQQMQLSMVGQGIEAPGMPVDPSMQPKQLPQPALGLPSGQ